MNRASPQAGPAVAEQGTTVLFATHYLDEADANASRIIVVSHGRIMADGTRRRSRPSGLFGLTERAGEAGAEISTGEGPGGKGFRLQVRVPAGQLAMP